MLFFSFVKRRNEKIIKTAVRSTAIVTSMFPSNVRDRLYKNIEENEKEHEQHGSLKNFLRSSDGNILERNDTKSAPLADLFTDTTVLVCIGNLLSFTVHIYLSKNLHHLLLQ